MIDYPSDISAANKKLTERDNQENSSPKLQRFFHELTNHLTVMNFSYFKVRDAAKPMNDHTISREIERMEKTIVDMALLLESISHEMEAMPRRRRRLPKGQSAKSSESNNVYPLFKRARPRRP